MKYTLLLLPVTAVHSFGIIHNGCYQERVGGEVECLGDSADGHACYNNDNDECVPGPEPEREYGCLTQSAETGGDGCFGMGDWTCAFDENYDCVHPSKFSPCPGGWNRNWLKSGDSWYTSCETYPCFSQLVGSEVECLGAHPEQKCKWYEYQGENYCVDAYT